MPPARPDHEPFLSGITLPVAGIGRLTYYNPWHGQPVERLRFEFQAPPWNATGRQPFAWELLPAAGKQVYPIVRVVAGREVTIRRIRTAQRALEVLGADNPEVELIRIQDDALLPDPERPLPMQQLVRRSYRLYQGMGERQLDQGYLTVVRQAKASHDSVLVSAMPAGVLARHDSGSWTVTVRCPRYDPAAFAYQVVTRTEDRFRVDVYVAHTRYVAVEAEIETDYRGYASLTAQLNVHVATLGREGVPRQGTDLIATGIAFREFTKYRFHGAASPDLGILIFEMVIGCIPVIGTLYDIGQFAYAWARGEDFWGRPVTDEDLLLMGVVAAVSVGFRGARPLRRLRTAAKTLPQLEPLLQPRTIQAIAGHAEPELIEALVGLSAKSKDEVIGLVEAVAQGGVRSMRAVASVAEIVRPGYQELIAAQHIARVFSGDVGSFRHPVLAEGYQAYRSRAGKLSAADWARAQRQGSRYHDELVAAIGPDYRDVIRVARDGEVIPVVAESAIRVFDRLAGRGPDSYRDLVRIRRRLGKGFGKWFEADHLLEQRFFLSPRVEDVLDPDDIFATLVPRNSAVARQLPGYASYVHLEKSNLLKRLIPVGSEDAFTLQQWWDAHVYAYTATGGDMKTILPRLREMFEDLAGATGEPLKFTDTIDLAALQRPTWRPASS